MLSLESVEVSFDGLRALKGISFSVSEGSILGLIGPNGSGKTTLFNVISGFIVPDRGSVRYQGIDITKLKPYKRSELGIGRLFQDVRVFRNLTVFENMLLAQKSGADEQLLAPFVKYSRLKKKLIEQLENSDIWLRFVGLDVKGKSLAGALSYGQEKLLALAMILAKDSKVLLLDEPIAGLDRRMKDRFLALINRLKELGKTVILIEHSLDFVFDISDKVILLSDGLKVYEGKPHGLRNRSSILNQVYVNSYA